MKITKSIVIVILFVAILIIAGLYLSQKKNNKSNNKSSSMLNKTVSDGDISFNITDSKCNAKKIGDDTKYLNASGQYCIASLTVTNKGAEDFLLKAPLQIAIDKDGQKYSGNAGAMYYLNNQSLLQPIKAKASVKGQIIFDIPKDKTISAYQLYSNNSTGGAKITL